MRLRVTTSLLCLGLTLSGVSQSAPEVIYDSGNTLPIQPYLGAVSVQRPQPPDGRTPGATPQPPAKPEGVVRLPIRTPEMQPGRLDRTVLPPDVRERLKALPRPLFLIGADPLSMRWLERFQTRLAELNAIGMLIDVESETALVRVQRLAGELVVVPASASELAKVLGVSAYPVLISKDGVEQ